MGLFTKDKTMPFPEPEQVPEDQVLPKKKELTEAEKKIAALRKELHCPASPLENHYYYYKNIPVTSRMPYVDVTWDSFYVNSYNPSLGLNALGLKIAEEVKGKNFFDIGCGTYEHEPLTRFILDNGANKYIGVDVYCDDIYRTIKREDGTKMEMYRMQEEMAHFLHSLPDQYGGNFLFSGIEERSFDEDGQKFVKDIMYQLHRVMKVGDCVIIGHQSMMLLKEYKGVVTDKNGDFVDEDGEVLFKREEIDNGKKHSIDKVVIYRKV